jgi:cation diffusion facilitator CzcD-associated flavoprotein CzcO
MRDSRICVIGAGPSGLAAAKNCLQAGLDVTVFEKSDRVGGNWVFDDRTGHSSVFENTHIISSRRWSEYEDFPMPAGYPDFPRHDQLLAYFEAYARHFGLLPHIRFNCAVEAATRCEDGRWEIAFADGRGARRSERFDYLMVANGHHNDPKYPEYPGDYTGRFLHAHDFKRVDESWRDKRVLVIGAGNSACDVAVEAARVAGKVCLSMRSPQWFIPRLVMGMPSDVVLARMNWLPRRLKQSIIRLFLFVWQGPYSLYGLPENVSPPLSGHPTINSQAFELIRLGRIHPRKAILRWSGRDVTFADGAVEAFDIVCACTGYWTTFPFFAKDLVDFKLLEKIPLYRKMMHAEFANLYFIGLFQPIGSIWPLADYQARLACEEILGNYRRPADMAAAIADELDHPHYRFSKGQRHAAEVDYHAFREELRRELLSAGVDIGKAPGGVATRYKKTPVRIAPASSF